MVRSFNRDSKGRFAGSGTAAKAAAAKASNAGAGPAGQRAAAKAAKKGGVAKTTVYKGDSRGRETANGKYTYTRTEITYPKKPPKAKRSGIFRRRGK